MADVSDIFFFFFSVRGREKEGSVRASGGGRFFWLTEKFEGGGGGYPRRRAGGDGCLEDVCKEEGGENFFSGPKYAHQAVLSSLAGQQTRNPNTLRERRAYLEDKFRLARWHREICVKFYFFASGFYFLVPGLFAMSMFCLSVHSRATLLCGSHSPRFKVQSCAIRLPIGRHVVCPHTHHAERHSFVFLKFSGMTTQHLTARTTTIVCFGTSFGEIFHWRNLPGEICWRNLPGEICLAKFAGEICWRICRRNLPAKFAAEFVGEIFGEKHLVKTSLTSGEKPPPKISLANSTVLKMCHRHIPRTLPAFFEVGPREQLRSRDSVCSRSADSSASKRHEEGYQSWDSLLSLQSREPCGIVTAQLH